MERPPAKPSTRETRSALYEDAVRLMRSECGQELTLEEVARRIATSPRQLQRAFDEAGAPPFAQFLTSVRMERAAELLRDANWPVIDVATAVGYARHSAFTKAFRRHYGVAPSAMRSQAEG